MGLYENYILPRFINCACGTKPIMKQREKVVPRASGTVLEIGIGTALKGMRRVLKPGGELIFCEHGLAPDESVRTWQDRINPVWRKMAGGCNINRNIPGLLHGGGFSVADMETGYLPSSPKFASFNYWGSAQRL